MRRLMNVLAVCIVAVLVCGCAAAPFKWDGPEQGIVTKIAQGTQLKNIGQRECVTALPREEALLRSWAVVKYRVGRGWAHKTLPMSAGGKLAVGDRVEFDLGRCAGTLHRVDP